MENQEEYLSCREPCCGARVSAPHQAFQPRAPVKIEESPQHLALKNSRYSAQPGEKVAGNTGFLLKDSHIGSFSATHPALQQRNDSLGGVREIQRQLCGFRVRAGKKAIIVPWVDLSFHVASR